MTNNQDIRWRQRFSNYEKALGQLRAIVELCRRRGLSDVERQGLIKAFEFTYELSWNVMKDFFEYQGNPRINGSRDAFREAFKRELILDGEGWMDMIVSRNKSAHTYHEETAREIEEKVITHYFDLFDAFAVRMRELLDADI
jgi:nucleotidyltransferase substrate binding protein (TIGR01987 family)